MADMLNILSGFMRGRSKRRQEDLQLEQLKLQTQARRSTEKLALEREKRAMIKEQRDADAAAQKQKLLDMFLQRYQTEQGTEPGQSQTTPMGESVTDALSKVELSGGQQAPTGQSPMSKMSPMDMAIMKMGTGIDTLGAGRLEEQQGANQRLGRQGDERIAIANKNLELNQKKVNYLPQKTKDGSTMMVGFDPLGKPTGQSFFSAGPPVETKEIDMPDGGKGYQIINKRSGAPMSAVVPTKHPPMPAAETASKVTLAMEAQNMIPQIKDMLWKNGKYDKDVVYQASLPLGGVGKGRALKSMFMDALDARIRAATGAAVTKEEWPAYFRMYLPQILDSEPLAKDKIKRLENFMGSYLETLDPKGIIRNRVKATKTADFVYNPATGSLE
uniref:Uncharacterized protein n=1 Tax=viral metagenome TaxID=1070528 RepID=A0A6M3L545_9ZZZZ